MKDNSLLLSAICLFLTLVIANADDPNHSADGAAEERVEQTEEAFSQPLSAAALNSADAVVIAKLTHAHLQRMAKSFPPIYSYSLGLNVEEVLSGEGKVGAQLELRHGAKQLHPPAYPVGRRMLVAVKVDGGAPRVHAIAVASDEALVKARAALSASKEPVIGPGNSNTAGQARTDQPAAAAEPRLEGNQKAESESEGHPQ